MLSSQIPFEVHLTIEGLQKDSIPHFEVFCKKHGGKAILIELFRGDHVEQPMFTKVYHSDMLQKVRSAISSISSALEKEGFRINRTKIEVPANEHKKFTVSPSRYFEWHGKIKLERKTELLQLCDRYSVHLSNNALQHQQAYRFVTLREYGTKETFDQRIHLLLLELESGGWQLLKKQSEFCIHDTNSSLDKGWLIPN
jgi:hypothetical protein